MGEYVELSGHMNKLLLFIPTNVAATLISIPLEQSIVRVRCLFVQLEIWFLKFSIILRHETHTKN